MQRQKVIWEKLILERKPCLLNIVAFHLNCDFTDWTHLNQWKWLNFASHSYLPVFSYFLVLRSMWQWPHMALCHGSFMFAGQTKFIYIANSFIKKIHRRSGLKILKANGVFTNRNPVYLANKMQWWKPPESRGRHIGVALQLNLGGWPQCRFTGIIVKPLHFQVWRPTTFSLSWWEGHRDTSTSFRLSNFISLEWVDNLFEFTFWITGCYSVIIHSQDDNIISVNHHVYNK